MKGTICGIKRMEMHDGDGIRTTVFFKGCSLRCIWCHNPESISFEKQIGFFENKCVKCGLCKGTKTADNAENCPTEALVNFGREYDVETLVKELAKDKAYFDNSGGGITLSGGECLMQPYFAREVAKSLCGMGIGVYIDTCGYVKREALEMVIPYVRKFLYDIKAMDADVHKKCTGKENDIILDNLKFLIEKNCDIEIRYPLVKGYNDDQVVKTAEFLKNLKFKGKIKVLQYHSFAASRYKALDMECRMPAEITEEEDVAKAVEIFKGHGLSAINGIYEN